MSDYVPLEKFQDFFQANRLVPKYNPSSERRIPHQYWELDSPKIDSLLKELSTLITGAIGKVPNGDLELSHVFRTGGSLRLIPRGPPMKFALVGAQGVGKSLLLNALFNRDGISLTGADGKACTNVMVRYAHYRGPQSDGKDQFVAEVEFFDDETLEKLIDEHAKAYYHVQHADEDSDDEESSRKRSHTQDEIDRRQKDTAEEIFCTLFGSKDNFLQAWSAETYHNGEFGQLCLIQCKTAMRSQNPSSKGIATFVSETPEDLLSQVKPLMAKTENRRSLWPLVKCVTIRFHDALLEQNIEILDLPGWGDTNSTRARYADDIKDSVDVEIIVADIIRITTDDAVISKARAAISNHGIRGAIIVPTKIDILSENQIDQCKGPGYDEIKAEIQAAEEQIDDEDEEKGRLFERRKIYLERHLRALKIHERNTQVIQELSGKFHGKEPNDSVQIFPISAGEYMSWIKKNKLRFDGQPTLSPTDTGIPKLRQTLMRYPADQNLKSYKEFVFVDLPYFIDKVKRVTTDTDRDIDFKNIADDFDNHRIKIIPKILDFAKKLYQNCTDTGMEHMRTQLARYKKQVDNMVNNQWTSKKGPTWNMILKFQGSIPPGASKAKGLEQGCDWCLDLSQVFASGFEKWHAAQKKEGADINRKLFGAFQTFHALYMNNMDRSSAGIQTTEKAKKHYQPHIDTVNAKLKCLAKRMTAKQGRLLRRATMEDRTQNSFIPGLTRPMFDEIFKAIPAIKSSEPGKKTKYVEPKVRFQKRRMMEIFIGEENHFVDKMLEEFALFVDSVMERLLEQTFKAIDDDFKQYSTYLRGRAPVNYEIDQKGYDIRVTLVEILPEAEKFVKELRQCFPKDIQDWKPAESENSDGATNDAEFSILFDRSTKRKVSITAGTVKEEAGTKRPCL